MRAGEDEPQEECAEDGPQDYRTVGPTRQPAIAAEARAAAPQQLLERRDVARSEARTTAAPRRLSPWTGRTVVARRIASAVAAALAPGALGVGEQAANAAAPPGNCCHRKRI